MDKVRSSSFIAIGVGQGDAFFLKRAGLAVLIDGGRSIQGFPTQFQRVTKQDRVDILVCTHNDADHAYGILGFLSSGLTCKEVWLPGSWTYRLKDLLLYPGRFTGELISNINENEEKLSPDGRPLLLQDFGDQYSERRGRQEGDKEDTAYMDDLSEALERAAEIEAYERNLLNISPLLPPEVWLYPWHTMWSILESSYGKFQLFIEAISAAALIRKIALAAYHMGALIRWFEYDATSKSGGIPNVLVPINAREIFRIRTRHWSAFNYVALTTSNKESLVFLSPANCEEPAVLFTADSDLSFSQSIPWSDGMLITAPHHGSEANAHAYHRFIKETANGLGVIWVRSDGRFKTRPGNSYLKFCKSRFCTLCRGSNYPKQDVHLMVASRKWRPIARECCCV